MRSKFLAIVGTLILSSSPAFAFNRRDVELSEPVGADVLPGGAFAQDEITTSILFARVIPFVIRYAIRLAVALAVIAVIIAGYQMLTAYGDTEKRQKAQKTLTWAIVGLILAIMAFGIVSALTSITLVNEG